MPATPSSVGLSEQQLDNALERIAEQPRTRRPMAPVSGRFAAETVRMQRFIAERAPSAVMVPVRTK